MTERVTWGHSGRRLIWLALLLCLALVAAACGGDDGGGDEPAAEEPAGATDGEDAEAAGGDGEELEPLVVSMPVVPPNFVMMQPWIAQELGYFEEFGLPEVEIITLETGIASLRGAQAGSADIAAPPTPALIIAVAEGASVKSFYSYSPGLEVQLVVTEDIQECEDLEGQVLGIDEVGGFAEVLTKFFYQSCGLTQEDVEYQSFPGAEGQAMAQGQAVSGVLHIDEAQNIMRQFPDAGLHALANLWEVVPDWHYAGYGSTQEIIDTKRDELVAFTAATIKANQFMKDTANKDRVVEISTEITEVPEDIIAETYDTFIEDGIYPDDNGYPEEMVEFTAQQQVEIGTIESEEAVPAYEDVVDPSIYEDALELVEAQG